MPRAPLRKLLLGVAILAALGACRRAEPHPPSPPARGGAAEAGPGLYRIPDFDFPAAGDWILTTHAELPDGRTRAMETRITVPGP